jgi:hypothetical protein
MKFRVLITIGFVSSFALSAKEAKEDALLLNLLNINAANSYNFSIEREFKSEILLEEAAKEDNPQVVAAKLKLIQECEVLRDKSIERLKNLNLKYVIRADCLTLGMNTHGQSIASESTTEGDWAWLTGRTKVGSWRYQISTKLLILF